MVGVTPPQPQTQPPPTAEEEALKRNTDCVYFLASPLTCKKGSECEYRHSDVARVNPRDCWYWLNGNCLNPKCGFRHPPLDGLLGTQVPTPAGPSLPPPHSLATPAINAPYLSGKQGVPCIFFQKGFCLKGDRCPFLHAPNSVNNKVSQLAAAASATDPSTLHKTSGGLEKSTQEQKVPQMKVTKSVELPPQGKPAVRVETALSRNGVAIDKYIPPPSGLDDELRRHRPTNAPIATSSRNGVAIEKYVPPPSGLDDEHPRYRPTNVPLATDGNSINRSNFFHDAYVPDDHSILNGKDIDEFSREPSPGFDVLVDDELGDSDYYQNEDQFGRRSNEGKNLNPMNDYDIGRSSDYKSMADVDRGMYHDPRGYDSYEYLQGQYDREKRIASSERMLGGSALERRRYPRADSPDRIEESDLRHLLAKQRRGNGLRSVISRDQAHENHTEDRSYRAPRRDPHHLPPHEGSLSSRLRGRIKILGRSSSPVNENGLRSEREMDRGRNRVRLSPTGRPQIFSHQGRLRDRIKERVQEDFDNEGRNFRGARIRRDIIDDNNIEFNGPKRLAELKVGKNAESYEHMNDRQSLGKRKYPKLESHQQSEGVLSFEGPKPLSEILKRKRGSEAADFESGMASGINEDKTHKGRKENLTSIIMTTESRGILTSVSDDEANHVHSSKRREVSKDASGDIRGAQEQVRLIHTEEGEPIEGHSSLHHNLGELENEKVKIGDEAMEDDNEPEAYDQTGESDYEQVDGEDYHLGEGENADPEEEYLDDDDFAKKMGLMYS